MPGSPTVSQRRSRPTLQPSKRAPPLSVRCPHQMRHRNQRLSLRPHQCLAVPQLLPWRAISPSCGTALSSSLPSMNKWPRTSRHCRRSLPSKNKWPRTSRHSLPSKNKWPRNTAGGRAGHHTKVVIPGSDPGGPPSAAQTHRANIVCASTRHSFTDHPFRVTSDSNWAQRDCCNMS